MSEIDSEDFLSRWSRLKHESAGAVPEEHSPPPDQDAPSPDRDAPPVAAVDPAVLPPVESIVADSDIRPYLEAHVPPELTSAALRRAWAADPVIRDFIGIADNQWDFNDHAAIPGFGALEVTDYLVDQALGRLIHGAQVPDGAQVPAESPVAVEQSPPGPEPRRVEPVNEIPRLAVAPPVESLAGPAAPRSHGGALPK